MSPDLDSEAAAAAVSLESVPSPSKYSIARRNQSAKWKFLNGVNNQSEQEVENMSRFQRNSPARRSLPAYSRTESPYRYGLRDAEVEEDESEFDKRDLSIPGTPVSSRHVMSLKYRNQLAEKERKEKESEFERKLQDSDDPLLKFIESMKKLAAIKRADLEQGIVREPPKPKIPTPPSPLARSKFGYNRMGSWNGDSNLRAYTPLFQRSMTVKLSSINVEIPKPNPVNDNLAAAAASTTGCVAPSSGAPKSETTTNWERPNLPKPPTSLIINATLGQGSGSGEEDADKPRRPLKHRSLSNADSFHEIRHRLER